MSAETKWTPGPWHWVDHKTDEPWTPETFYARLETVDQFDTGFVGELPKFILITEGFEADTEEEIEANAHLIAAAPELYEALKTLIEASDGGTVYEFDRAHDIAHEALSRARGGS